MAGGFRGFTLEAEQLSGRLREVLSSGQAYVLTRFGVDPGLHPDLYPTWIALSATALVVLLLLALCWAAARGAPPLGKAPASRVDLRGCEPDLAKPVRAEEQRKRSKKKPPEKVRRAAAQRKRARPLFVPGRSGSRPERTCWGGFTVLSEVLAEQHPRRVN